ncbi:MAG TPA: GNAT family N-acetyltransferase, partial [Puia sp.]|nr:GNAT family N-acetyltransferase [Puia sp.]
MSNLLTKEPFSRHDLFGMPVSQYRVERVGHHQRHLYADLFNQHGDSRRDYTGKAIVYPMNEGWFNSESVLYVVLTNYPASVPVGFIQLYLMSFSIHAASATIVHDLYVLPAYRNNGAALKLVEAAVKFAILNHSDFIRLEILEENLSAKKLFESVGFKCH